ncbi:MAG: hypothetical protein ACJ8G5_14790, partial [Burkholderiales bacterium]
MSPKPTSSPHCQHLHEKREREAREQERGADIKELHTGVTPRARGGLLCGLEKKIAALHRGIEGIERRLLVVP